MWLYVLVNDLTPVNAIDDPGEGGGRAERGQ